MNLMSTGIPGVFSIKAVSSRDSRGQFSRLFCDKELQSVLHGRYIRQINRSITSKAGAIRGMHYQMPPYAEMKIIQCLQGSVFDVAVDLRENSSTYLKWIAFQLDSESINGLIIPEGCAHGFQALREDSELVYFHTAPYTPKSEGGVRYDDPLLSIKWPLPCVDVSARDLSHPLIDKSFKGITI